MVSSARRWEVRGWWGGGGDSVVCSSLGGPTLVGWRW